MLKEVLQKMLTSNVCSRASLARRLGVSEGLLSQMMELLMRKGYIATLETPSSCEGCGGCGGDKACGGCGFDETNELKGWALTAKGRKAAERRQDWVTPR